MFVQSVHILQVSLKMKLGVLGSNPRGVKCQRERNQTVLLLVSGTLAVIYDPPLPSKNNAWSF